MMIILVSFTIHVEINFYQMENLFKSIRFILCDMSHMRSSLIHSFICRISLILSDCHLKFIFILKGEKILQLKSQLTCWLKCYLSEKSNLQNMDFIGIEREKIMAWKGRDCCREENMIGAPTPKVSDIWES